MEEGVGRREKRIRDVKNKPRGKWLDWNNLTACCGALSSSWIKKLINGLLMSYMEFKQYREI